MVHIDISGNADASGLFSLTRYPPIRKRPSSSDVLAHVAHNDQGYEVESFDAARWNEVKKLSDIEVKWRGLDEAEKSWEPAQNLCEDLPGPLMMYL